MNARGCSARQASQHFHLKSRQCLLSGVLIIVPFAITLAVVLWLFGWLRKLLLPLVNMLFNALSTVPQVGRVDPIYLKIVVSALAILLLMFIVYMVGVIGTRVLGRRLIATAEGLIRLVPVVGSLYSATKQVVETFGSNDKPAYKSVVLVEFPRLGCKSVGFLTGVVTLSGGKRFAKVFIPTAPNPTTGYFELIPVEEVEELDLSVEDTFKMILSVGMLSPEALQVSLMTDKKI
jgi:uncharacterized membrane protein